MRILAFLATVLVVPHSVVSAESRPLNLVAILTDDQAAWTLGCYGGKEIPTPNLDRLAASGTRFANAFVHTPVCSPSRATYLTALQSTQVGFTDWLNPGQSRKHGITPDTPTWPAVLAKNGYATGMIGKWHLGDRDGSLPWQNGVAEFTGTLGGGWSPNHVRFIDQTGKSRQIPGFSVEICTDLAIRFINAHKDRPFALLVNYREPHSAYVPMPAPDMEAAAKATVKTPAYPKLRQPYADKQRREYFASIAAVDRNVGLLLDDLEKTGLASRTVVVFTSDHGYNVGEHGIQHKGNGRWITEDRYLQSRPNMYDTSIRVPLIVRHPSGKSGLVSTDWVTNADTFATVLGLLDVKKPAAMPAASRDFSPAVFGEKLPAAGFPHELFGQYDLINDAPPRQMRMIRTDRWKLVLHLNLPSANELYDLAADPGETQNIFGKPGTGDATRDLTAQLRGKMESINDPRLKEMP